MSAGSRGAAEDERRFELLVASVKDYAIFLLDTSGHVATWNAGAQLIKGYRPEEIVGKHISVFYAPEDAARGRPQALLAAARQEGRVEDEGWRVRKDGTRFWADVVITAVVAEGAFRGFIKVTRDLTSRRQAEEELRQSEARFEADGRERSRLRALHDRPLRPRRHLEPRRPADQGVSRGRDPRSAVFPVLHAGGHRARPAPA